MKKPKHRSGKGNPKGHESGAAAKSDSNARPSFMSWYIFSMIAVLGIAAFIILPGDKSKDSSDSGTNNIAQKNGKRGWFTRAPLTKAHPELVGPAGNHYRVVVDPTASLTSRRKAARELARMDTDGAFIGLKKAIATAPAAVNAAIGEGLGENRHPEARHLLQQLLEHTDEAVVRGAIRGMAARGDAEAVSVLSGILSDAKKPESLRTEAALNLGEMEQPGVSKILVAAALSSTDESLTEHILTGLGKRPFNETQEFYREYIADKAVGIDAKAAALDALGNTPGPVSTFLVEQCSNPDPRLREAAARSLSQVDDPGNYAPAVITALQKETSPEVRARLYETLSNQKDFDSSAIVAMAKNETNLRAQLGAWHLLADLCRQQPTPEVTDYFSQKGVPVLKAMALQSTDAFNRLDSVITLRKAKTPESYTALEDISKTATDRRVVEAAQAAINSRPQRSPK